MASYSHKYIIQSCGHFCCFDDVTCGESNKNAAPCGDDSVPLP